MYKTIEIKLTKSDMTILDYYGFDYEKNLQDMCKRVAKQLKECERLLPEQENKRRIQERAAIIKNK